MKPWGLARFWRGPYRFEMRPISTEPPDRAAQSETMRSWASLLWPYASSHRFGALVGKSVDTGVNPARRAGKKNFNGIVPNAVRSSSSSTARRYVLSR